MNEKAFNALRKACQNFVNKVEAGKARSKDSYAEMKEALRLSEEKGNDSEQDKTSCAIHSTDKWGRCFKCGVQVFSKPYNAGKDQQ